jgi:hypothetical protein
VEENGDVEEIPGWRKWGDGVNPRMEEIEGIFSTNYCNH